MFIGLMLYLEASQLSYCIAKDELLTISNDTYKYTIIREIFDENVYTKPCIFKPFIDIFSSTNYSPSYFLPSELKVVVNDFNLLEYIIYNQYTILDYQITTSMEYISGLQGILEQYQTIGDRILV